jgi:ABC-type cobalamin transport system ATPase subunit
LSPYCYKVEDSADDFDDVLGGLEAHYKQMNAQNLASKGELIDTIIRGGVSKTIRSVAGILDVIGSLTLWHIREVEARTLATKRGHKLVSQEDKSNAATEMWQHLRRYNSDADRAKLDARISAGIRWNRFMGSREIGMIVPVHKLPPSL